MELQFIPLDRLVIAKANMRWSRKPPDVADILPTIRARGVLQPLIVRPGADQQKGAARFEILAGARRFHAAWLIAEERRAALPEEHQGPPAGTETLPCAVLAKGDDAAAVEASLIENLARLAPHEVDQWTAFVRLTRAGRTPAEIAATFGLSDLAVRRVLALGNLLPRIRTLYRREELDPASVRHLTLASPAQQKAWLALFDDPQAWCPTGRQLKSWLFGGQAIPVAHALFDVAQSGCATVADLFGEERYFADSAAFWEAQNAAIAALAKRYRSEGWSDAVVLPPESHFYSWEHAKTPKRKGGRVYIAVRGSGEVTCHEGFLTLKEARRLERSSEEKGSEAEPLHAELSSVTARYVDLHRHAAVRAAMLAQPGVALRLMIAHAIAGSPLWHVGIEQQACRKEDICENVETSRAEALFDERRRAVLALLDLDGESPTLTASYAHPRDGSALFARLLELPDPVVFEVAAIAMGETLAAGSAEVAAAGLACNVEMRDWWEADAAFVATLRRRDTLLAILAEVAGEAVSAAHAGESLTTLRTLLLDLVGGRNGRAKCDPWIPRWMAFPCSSYRAAQPSNVPARAGQENGERRQDAQEATAEGQPSCTDQAPGVGESLAADREAERPAQAA